MAWIVVVAALGAGFLLTRPVAMATVYPAATVYQDRAVAVDGSGSYMAQGVLEQAPHTTGPSPDVIRLRFSAPVCVTGVLVSVDVAGPSIAEVAVGVNATTYAVNTGGWLIHTSDSNGGRPSKIDESMVLPSPVCLGTGDHLGIAAWLMNEHDVTLGVSPEVIVYYQP